MAMFFDILSYYGGLLAMLTFISGFVIFVMVTLDIRKQNRKNNTIEYEWEELE
jgi:hypothetical protein